MKKSMLILLIPLLMPVDASLSLVEGIDWNRKINISTQIFNAMIERKQESKIINELCTPKNIPKFHVDLNGRLVVPDESVVFLKNVKVGPVILYKDPDTKIIWLVKQFNLSTNQDDLEYILREINIGLKVTNTLLQVGNGPVSNLVHVDRCIHDKSGNYDFIYAFYPYFEKGSINEYIDAHRKEFSTVSFSWKFQIMEKIAEAIQLLSTSDTGHRDIKPQNIMMKSHTQPIIIDYGLSKKFQPLENDVNTVAGTLRYIAPEVFDSHYGVKADVYSLGLVFFEILNNFNFRSVEELKVIAKNYCQNIPQTNILINHWEKHTYCTKFEPLVKYMTFEDPDQRININTVVDQIKIGKGIAAEEDEKWRQSLRSFTVVNLLNLHEQDPNAANLLKEVIDTVRRNDNIQANQNNQLLI